jgi:hypothetical protein
MLTINDLLPLVEPKTLLLFAKKKGINVDNLLQSEIIEALSKS